MAHFPQLRANVRAPRVNIPGGRPVSFYLENRPIPAVLRKISTTGGLAESAKEFRFATLAELKLDTGRGPVVGLVELLHVQQKETTCLQPFRFIALNDNDHDRLKATLELMRRRRRGR